MWNCYELRSFHNYGIGLCGIFSDSWSLIGFRSKKRGTYLFKRGFQDCIFDNSNRCFYKFIDQFIFEGRKNFGGYLLKKIFRYEEIVIIDLQNIFLLIFLPHHKKQQCSFFSKRSYLLILFLNVHTPLLKAR